MTKPTSFGGLEMPFKVIDSGGVQSPEASSIRLPGLGQIFVAGHVDTAVGKVPQVSAVLTLKDHWGTFKARWGVGRMRYAIDPGLYALGRPDDQAPVLVTSNYKMSFDRLREALVGRSAWILVLDTQGINVWCAAGKGTFGTQELVKRLESNGLARIVSHRQLILPQLAGPGVAAHRVRKLSGFSVVFGPVRAKDLAYFMDNGLSVRPEMRQKTFNMGERVVLIPVELVQALKAGLIVIPVMFLAGGLGNGPGYWKNAWDAGLFAAVALLLAILTGCIGVPIFLPWLPGRAFSTKGFFIGLATAIWLILYRSLYMMTYINWIELAAWFFLVPAVTAYLALNFTGASTYTSLSGVKKEMRWAVPAEIAAGVIGLGLWIGSRFYS
jgi:acetyl-CoA decarbonylase/synthase complex subunit gamma